MADEEEDFRTQRALIEQELRNKELELEALRDIGREAGFTPRASLARTPPQGFSTPPVFIASSGPGTKRLLSSPEEVQEAVRRRMQTRRADPPAAPPPSGSAADPIPQPLSEVSTEKLISLATSSTSGIMDAVRCKTSKLNKDEIAAIGQYVDAVGSVITHLMSRLAAAELRAVRAEACTRDSSMVPPTQGSAPLVRSYAGAIKLGRNSAPVPIPERLGPAVAVFPAEDQVDALKTADDTKRVLKVAVDPAGLGIKVQGVRRTGGAGVIIQTTSEKDANAFKAALPATLRVGDTRERKPLIALVGVDADTKPSEMITQLHEQNLTGLTELEDLKKNLRPLFQRTRRNNKRAWVCECTADLRRQLMDLSRVYVGWDAVEVLDHIGVTCCRKCQMFGHPEKYCRAKIMTCGKCGEDGHKNAECQANCNCCATCKKLKRKGAADHYTNSPDCPARKNAEERSIINTNYGQ